MNLSDIISISGKPGLYKIVAQSPGRVIVESVQDGKRTPVFMRDNFSILSDIYIFTDDEDMPLGEVMKAIYEHEGGQESISHKGSDEELETRLKEVVSNYDKENVQHADMRKLFKWYNLLIKHDLWSPADLENEDEEEIKAKKKLLNDNAQKPQHGMTQSAGKSGTSGSKASKISMNRKTGG